MTNVVARVSKLAAGQWGLLTTAQAAREGITRLQLARLADAGVLQRLGRGIYATTSSADEHLDLRAAWLALDPARTAEERLKNPITAGVVSHASAAGLHNLGDLLDDEHEVTLPQRKQTRREGIRVHRGDLTEQDVTIVEGLPVTTEERTIADLLRAGHDPEHVAQIIGQGVRRGVVDLTHLAAYLDPLARRHDQPDGDALVEYLLDLVGLSPAALARELARSSTGQELVAAGRLSAIGEMLGSVLPKIDTTQLLGLESFIGPQILGMDKLIGASVLGVGKFDFAKIAGLQEIIGRIQPLNPAIAQIQELTKGSLSPSIQTAIASMQSPVVQAAIAAAQSPSAEAARRWLESDQGKQAYRAATKARHAEGDEADG
jgi:Transcriptional regulator, AbiEi antitoxin